MSLFRPKYISFDCYGTLTRFQMSDLARDLFADAVPQGGLDQFVADFAAYRFDEVLGDWKPYRDVVVNAVERTTKRWKLPFSIEIAEAFYHAVPSWGPHPDVMQGLARVAGEIPLVILSNAMDEQIASNVEKLGVPFHRVCTAEQAGAYKPRLRAFEYMLDSLRCTPDDVLHVSSSLRYDLMSARDIGIRNKVFVARGHEPGSPACGYTEIKDIGGLAAVVGL